MRCERKWYKTHYSVLPTSLWRRTKTQSKGDIHPFKLMFLTWIKCPHLCALSDHPHSVFFKSPCFNPPGVGVSLTFCFRYGTVLNTVSSNPARAILCQNTNTSLPHAINSTGPVHIPVQSLTHTLTSLWKFGCLEFKEEKWWNTGDNCDLARDTTSLTHEQFIQSHLR